MPFQYIAIEQVKQFWDKRPCNIRHSPKPVGTREYFDEVEVRKYFVEPHIPRFAEFPRWQGKKVLWILLTYGKGQFWRLAELVARHSEAQTGCPITYTFTRRQIRKLLERYGFQVTEMWVDHIFPYRIPDYVQYCYVKVWYFRWMPKPLFRWIEKHFGWHLLVTAVAR